MRRSTIAGFALLAIHLGAVGQAASDGTIVTAQWSEDRIAVAADSRESWGPSYSDTACKIAVFGDKLVFSAAGMRDVRTQSLLFDSFAIARQQYTRLTEKGTPDHLALQLAAAWGEAVKQQLEQLGDKFGDVIIARLENQTVNQTVTSGLFANFEKDGTLLLVPENVKYEQVGRKIKITSSSERLPSVNEHSYVMGHTEIVHEFVARQTARAIRWNAEMTKLVAASDDRVSAIAINLVELTMITSPTQRPTPTGSPSL